MDNNVNPQLANCLHGYWNLKLYYKLVPINNQITSADTVSWNPKMYAFWSVQM